MYLFLDTETTGITPENRIVSICWSLYDTDGDELTSEYNIIYPDSFTIPSGAAAIHGITTTVACVRGIPLNKALTQLRNEIAEYEPELYVGHNVSFDRPIVLNEYGRLSEDDNISNLPTFAP